MRCGDHVTCQGHNISGSKISPVVIVDIIIIVLDHAWILVQRAQMQKNKKKRKWCRLKGHFGVRGQGGRCPGTSSPPLCTCLLSTNEVLFINVHDILPRKKGDELMLNEFFFLELYSAETKPFVSSGSK